MTTDQASALNTPLRNTFVSKQADFAPPNWGGGGNVTAVGTPGDPEKTLGWLVTGAADNPNTLAWIAVMPSPDDEWRRVMQGMVATAAAKSVSVRDFLNFLRSDDATNPFVLGASVWSDKISSVIAQAMPGA